MGNLTEEAGSSNRENSEFKGNQQGGCDSPFTIKIPIIGYETMEERAKFTIFKLRVENDKLEETWLVFRRYTDFVRLHSKLKEEVPPGVEIAIPPKRWLRDNFETAFLEERMKGLQAFVDSILSHPFLIALPTVRKFFCLDEPPVYSDSADDTKSWSGIDDSAVLMKHRLNEKEREIELMRAELALINMQKESLLKVARNCRICSQKQPVMSALSHCSLINMCSTNVPSSGSSSEHGSPQHKFSLNLPAQSLLQKRRRSSTSSKTNNSNLPKEGAPPSQATKILNGNGTHSNDPNNVTITAISGISSISLEK